MALLQLGQHHPRRRHAEQEHAKVDADADEVVDLGLALHRPRDGLPEGLEPAEDARVPRHRRQVGRVLAHEPVQELLEGLARELPEEDERVRRAEAAREPVVDGARVRVVVLLLQDDGPDPGPREDDDDGGEGYLGAGLDVDALAVEQRGDDEGAEDAGEVGEEGRECARADGEVCREPRAEEAVVKVADEEGRQEKEDPTGPQKVPYGLELGRERRLPLSHHAGAILAPDLLRWTEEYGDGQTQAHDNDESDIGRRADRARAGLVRVQAQVNSSSHNGTSSLCRLPYGKVESSVLRAGITDDDGRLGRPEESGRDTTEGTAEQHEPGDGRGAVHVETGAVDWISNTTQRQAPLQADPVVDGPGGDADQEE